MAEIIERVATAEAVARDRVGRMLDRIAASFTLFGGLTFCALIVMSIISIVGRKLFASPVQGDVELMQMGAAVGAAAFLPLCALFDHNVKVDALTGWMSDRGRAALDTLAHGLLAVAAVLITWRTALAAVDGYASGEVSTQGNCISPSPVCVVRTLPLTTTRNDARPPNGPRRRTDAAL